MNNELLINIVMFILKVLLKNEMITESDLFNLMQGGCDYERSREESEDVTIH